MCVSTATAQPPGWEELLDPAERGIWGQWNIAVSTGPWPVTALPWGHLCLWGSGCAGNQGALSPHFLENFGVSVILSSTSPAFPTTSKERVEGWETPSASNKPVQLLGELHTQLQQVFGAGSGGPALCSPGGPQGTTPAWG